MIWFSLSIQAGGRSGPLCSLHVHIDTKCRFNCSHGDLVHHVEAPIVDEDPVMVSWKVRLHPDAYQTIWVRSAMGLAHWTPKKPKWGNLSDVICLPQKALPVGEEREKRLVFGEVIVIMTRHIHTIGHFGCVESLLHTKVLLVALLKGLTLETVMQFMHFVQGHKDSSISEKPWWAALATLLPVPDWPWQSIRMDFRATTQSKGHDYLLVVMTIFTSQVNLDYLRILVLLRRYMALLREVVPGYHGSPPTPSCSDSRTMKLQLAFRGGELHRILGTKFPNVHCISSSKDSAMECNKFIT